MNEYLLHTTPHIHAYGYFIHVYGYFIYDSYHTYKWVPDTYSSCIYMYADFIFTHTNECLIDICARDLQCLPQLHMCIYMYIYICTCIHMNMFIYIYESRSPLKNVPWFIYKCNRTRKWVKGMGVHRGILGDMTHMYRRTWLVVYVWYIHIRDTWIGYWVCVW